MNDFISVDIETDFGGKKPRKMLNIGWCSSKTADKGKEHFIYQHEDSLYYPANVDQKYVGILEIWRKKKKTKLKAILTELLADTEGKTIVGWNIKHFDIPVIRRYFKNHLDIDWTPKFFDGYLAIKEYIKTHPHFEDCLKKVNGTSASGKFASLTAEAMYKYVTGSYGYEEYHTALFDAQDERHLIKNMARKWGLSVNKGSQVYQPKIKVA